MSALNPTPPDQLTDAEGRPYFLWDLDISLEDFEERLRCEDLDVRAYFAGKLMRQAKPDDVLTFLTPRQILALWPHVKPYLGKTEPFWRWLLKTWEAQNVVAR